MGYAGGMACDVNWIKKSKDFDNFAILKFFRKKTRKALDDNLL